MRPELGYLAARQGSPVDDAARTAPIERLRLHTGSMPRRLWAAPILAALGIPLLIALAPVGFATTRHGRRAEIVSAALLASFVVVAGFSIGLFYLPAALAAILVARRPSTRTAA
jgi:MFS family permease